MVGHCPVLATASCGFPRFLSNDVHGMERTWSGIITMTARVMIVSDMPHCWAATASLAKQRRA